MTFKQLLFTFKVLDRVSLIYIAIHSSLGDRMRSNIFSLQ